jgi:hypothetical protein
MANITLSIPKLVKMETEELAWVNFSELSKEELIKKKMFEKYVKTGKITDEEWKFCEEIDWHPVDWLPLREEFVKELKKAEKEPSIKFKSVKEIFE